MSTHSSMQSEENKIRHNWTREQASLLKEQPLMDLLFEAQTVHRQYFPANTVQISTLLSIKTGACPEDCGYCSQSGHYDTGITKQKLLPVDEIIAAAKKAKANGATRFCMGAGWRSPPAKNMEQLQEMVREVKALGMETCLTAGMLDAAQAGSLKDAGLDYYNHNLDSSPEYYPSVTSTRTYQDRLDTLAHVREAGIHVCCGGILGMGEQADDRVGLLLQLANLPEHPESVPLNLLVPIPGTPLGNSTPLETFEFVRIVALARLMMPASYVRLSAGRNTMSDELQAMCFFAGANSIHYGEKLLTTPLPDTNKDLLLFERLGIKPLQYEHAG